MTLLFASLLLAGATSADECWHQKKIGHSEEAARCFTVLANSDSESVRAEGLWGLGRFEDANAAFRIAVRSSPTDAHLKVRWGTLLEERFNPGEAVDLFGEALEIDPGSAKAMLAVARAFARNYDRRATEWALKACAQAPKWNEPKEVLAGLYLEDGEQSKAEEFALQALALSPDSMDAMAVLAARDLLNDRGTSVWTGKMLSVNPRYAEGYTRIARLFVLNRRYADAIGFYRKAIELDPTYLPAQSELGINLMRVGQDQEARGVLVKVYSAGYTDAATSNTLRLLDSYKNFVTISSPRYVLRLHKSEAEVLRPYVEREVVRALDTYDKKYGFTLPGPVSIEMYPDHEDFAVRTMGMPGLGALGVTFGLSVAMDSPSARPPGSFNWASTLWHELSHVYVLTATAHHVPRWFTEGVSVFEETASTKEWAEPVSKDASAAMKKDQLLPIQKLDRGFIRPDSPAQVGVSYFQAGQICEFIVETWGWEKILAMTRSFSKVTTTEAVVLSNLGLEPAEFDKRFKAWLAARKLEVAGPGTEHQRDPAHVKKAALEAQQRGDAAGAERMLTSLLAIYPVKDEELHRRLAAARAEVGNWPGAAEEWRTVIVMKTADPASAQYQLAVALRKMNRTDEARDAVLAALEAAPAYRPAQKLLLELNRKEQQ